MKIETLCNIALVAILTLAGYGAIKAVVGVVSAFSQPSAALVTKANIVGSSHASFQTYR